MSRFRYSFQKIVDLKTNEKTQAEWILSSAVNDLRVEEDQLSDLKHHKSEVQETLVSAAANRTTVSELMLYQKYLDHIDHQILNKNAAVRAAQINVEDKQSNLTAKMREEKVWSKAREKAKLHFTAALLKKDQEALDEMSVSRHKQPS
ncbi:flagellar export protein FliJ [Paenibacillus aurantius]|uniref:Flagellar FliJ protein n=1 Tax=Paenibacillus aurantius TaxID=2918900 RepID=A0AA96LGN5_9BACL|nr:flagellar export protein FliJ [Paenibacillus aurantius]WNQ13734.1 flagellar export protein FliJ [Paenibacillus aurantius]